MVFEDKSKKMNGQTTIYTLAKISGYSPATVSRALNDDKLISRKTREKINELARKYKYKKSPLARNLSVGRTGTIAVLLPTISNPIYTHLSAKIIEYAQKKNYTVFLNYSELDKEREKKILRSFANISADGFIVALTFSENKKELLSLAAQKPVIIRGFIDEDVPLDCVYVDFEKGSFDATTYLINSGHTKIFFAGALSCLNAKSERISGFENAMEKSGIGYSEENFIDTGTNIESAYKNSLKTLSKNKPTALIVQSDYLAFGVMRAISELKLRIPEDISIISFDNIEFSNYGMVPLTTMTQSVDEQAKILIDKLLSKISVQDSFPERIKLDTKMIVRNSVCKRKDA